MLKNLSVIEQYIRLIFQIYLREILFKSNLKNDNKIKFIRTNNS